MLSKLRLKLNQGGDWAPELAIRDTSSMTWDQNLGQDLDLTAKNIYKVIHQYYQFKPTSKPSPSAEKKDELRKTSSQIESVLAEPVGSPRKARLGLFKEIPAFHPDKFGAKNSRNDSLQRLSPNGFLFSRNNSRYRSQKQLGSVSVRLD
jgi:hypothetical protein